MTYVDKNKSEFGYLQKDAKCPNCHEALAKIPKRKSKCPHCEKVFYVRTRPSDREKVIVTEEGALAIEQAWAKYHLYQETAEWGEAIKNLPKDSPAYEKAHSLAKATSASGEHDKAWGYFNKARMKAAKAGDFFAYRNITLDMATHLIKEGREKQALSMHCEIHYYDMCGLDKLDNVKLMVEAGFINPRYLGSPWNPERGFRLVPGIVNATRDLMKIMEINQNDFKQIALKAIEPIISSMKGPVTPNDALPVLVEIAFGTNEPKEIKLPTY